MPFRDGTGPFGEGPGTGRGRGMCAGGRRGFGQGRGLGRRGGRGRGLNQQREASARPDQKAVLEEQASRLKSQIDQVDGVPKDESPGGR